MGHNYIVQAIIIYRFFLANRGKAATEIFDAADINKNGELDPTELESAVLAFLEP